MLIASPPITGFISFGRLGWYADAEAIRHSIEAERAFNLIHMQNVLKVDVFPANGDFHHSQLERATVVPVGPDRILCPVAIAEDSVLAKLCWYRDGGEISDQIS